MKLKNLWKELKTNNMEELYKTFETIRLANLKARHNNDYYKLLINGQALLDYAPQLIEVLVDNEHKYRSYEAKLALERDENGKLYSNSYCETQAKASEFYKEYKRAEKTLDWLYSSVNMSKKLALNVLEEENK